MKSNPFDSGLYHAPVRGVVPLVSQCLTGLEFMFGYSLLIVPYCFHELSDGIGKTTFVLKLTVIHAPGSFPSSSVSFLSVPHIDIPSSSPHHLLTHHLLTSSHSLYPSSDALFFAGHRSQPDGELLRDWPSGHLGSCRPNRSPRHCCQYNEPSHVIPLFSLRMNLTLLAVDSDGNNAAGISREQRQQTIKCVFLVLSAPHLF